MRYKIIFFIILLIITLSLINIYKWFLDNKDIEIQIKSLDNIEIKEIENNDIIDDDIESIPYENYSSMNLIYVDFDELSLINKDIYGWIQVLGTNINYPFVKYKDNNYYLHHSIDKSKNDAGWIFLDYRNNLDDKNIILYGHGRVDKTLFGSLRDIFDSNWYLNKDNHYIKIATKKELSLWQVFSVYRIKTTSDYLQINFNDQEYESFLNLITNRSYYSFNIKPNIDDRIITLSTCYNKESRVVMHAKLIKKEVLNF